MAQHASDSVHAAGKLPPTLTPTGQFAGKPTLPISRSVTLIGSRKQARLQLISSTVSQNHALIVNADSGPYIRDLASRSHVLVNGQAVKESPLKEGDEIQIGRFTFRFNESPQTRGVAKKDVEPAASARMVVDGADLPVPIDGKSMLVGRREICDIHLLEDTCSTTHAIVFEMDGRRYIRDLASRTGTFVNGKQIHQVELMPGDEIKIAETTMRYMADAAPGVTAEEEMAPTDLAADVGDLIPMENEAPVAPVSRAAAPATATRDAEDIAADALEMVQDQPAEIEPVEAAPAELEIEPVDVEEPPAAEPQATPQEIESPPADVEAVEMEPLEIEPVAEEPAPAPVPPQRSAAPATSAKRPAMPDQLAAMNWAANQDQFLGGQPMALPPLPVGGDEPFIRDDSGDTAAEEDLLVPIGDEASHQPAPAEAPAPEAPAEADLELEPLDLEPAAPATSPAPQARVERMPPREPEPLEVEAVEPEAEIEIATPPAAAEEEIELEPEAQPEPIAQASGEPLTIEPVEESEPQPLAEAEPAAREEAEEPLEITPVEAAAAEPEVEAEPELKPISIAPAEAEAEVAVEPEPEPISIAPVEAEVEPEPVSLAPVEEAEPEPVAEVAPPPTPVKAPTAPPRPAAKVAPAIPPVPPVAPIAPAPTIAPSTAKLEPPSIRMVPTPPPAAPASPTPAPKKPEPVAPPSAPKKVELPAPPAKVVERPRPAAEAPKPAKIPATPPPRRTPVMPAALPADAFKAPVEEPTPDFTAAVSEADVADELKFDLPEETEPLAAAGTTAPLADELEDITAAPIPPMPDFSDIEADTIDFAAEPALPESTEDAFAVDESADEIAPLDLETAEAEAAQALDFDLGAEVPPVVEEEPLVEEPLAEEPLPEAPIGEGEAPAEPEPSRSSDVAAEVIEATEATPESAQVLDEVDEAAPSEAVSAEEDEASGATAEAPTPTEEVSLTDSTFGRAVEEFVGESTTGPIVEDRAPEAPEAPAELEQRGKAPAESVVPRGGFVSRFGPGASQLDLEPIGEEEPLHVTDEQEEPATAAPEAEVEEPTTEQPRTPEPIDINGPLDVEAIEAEQEAERAAAGEHEEPAPQPVDDVIEIEPVEAPPDALLTQQQDEIVAEPQVEPADAVGEAPAAPREKLFDLEPIETPASRATPEPLVEPEPLEAVHDDTIEVEPVEAQEHIELEPLDQPLAIEDEIKLTQTPQAAAAPTPTPVDELPEAFELEPEAIEVEPVETPQAPIAKSQAPAETHEPFEIEAEAVEVEPEPFEPPAEPPVASRHAGEPALEPIDLDALALESLGDASAGAAAGGPTAELPEIPEIEPIEVEAEPEPVAEAPKPAAAPVTPPVTPTPPPPARTTPPPAAGARTTPPPSGIRPPSPQPPPQPQGPIPTPMGDAFSWGANAEHFLGGQPLQLTPTIPPTRPPPPQQPSQQQQRPPSAPSPFAGATPSTQRPASAAPRRPMPTPVPQQPRQQPPPEQRGGKKPPTPVATGFDGLALGADGGTSAGDVFTQKPISLTGGFDPGLVSDVFAGRRRATGGGGAQQPPVVPATGGTTPAAGDGAGTGATPTPQPRARRATKAEPMGDAWTPNEKPIDAMAGNGDEVAPASQRGIEKAAAAAAPEPEAAPIPPRKKRRWFGLRLILWILLLPAMAGAAWGIWNYLPLHSVVTGVMKFANVGALPQLQRKALEQQQAEIVKSLAVRMDARTKLVSVGGKGSKPVSPGFIGDDVSYLRTVTDAKFEPDTGSLVVRYVGAGTPEDRLRMLALLQAVHSANGKNVQDAQRLTQNIEDLTTAVAESERRMADLQKQIDDLTAKAQDKPTAADRTALEADAGRLESAYNAAVANVTKLTAELKALREGVATATTQPTALAPDDQLAKLQGELDQLNTKVGAIQDGRGEKAKAARSQLDTALESFNKQLVEAQAAVKDNPQLLAYLTDAHKLLDSTKQLTDQLIKRQQDQYGQLSELKARLNEKMLARRAEVWKKDPELVKLMDEKDIKTRQYNAAVGQNMSKEAAEIKTDLDYLDSSIRARQTVVADDSFYADAIDQLQKIIDTTQKGLEDDRKSTMQQLDEMQAMLARSQPSLDSLTPQQKELATKMEKSLADVSQARKQYTDAADAANKAADEEIRNLQQNASELASKVAQRKQQIAQAASGQIAAPAPAAPAVDPAKAIEQKSAELAAAEKTRAEAEGAFFAANKKLVDLRNRMDQARQAGELRDKLLATKTGLDQELVNRRNALDEKKEQAKLIAYPAAAPTATDISLIDHGDQRPAYILGACGALFGLCVVVELLGRTGGTVVDDRASESSDYSFESYEPDLAEQSPPPRGATAVEV